MKAWSEFEQQIENTNQFYLRKGYGVVTKIPNGTKTIRKYGNPIIVPSDKTGCDFIGFLKMLPIAFDAKTTENKTAFPINVHGKRMLQPHQVKFLIDFKRTGGHAYVLIRFNKSDEVFLVDIDKYIELEQKALKANKKSIPIAWFGECRVERNGYYYDYLKQIANVA